MACEGPASWQSADIGARAVRTTPSSKSNLLGVDRHIGRQSSSFPRADRPFMPTSDALILRNVPYASGRGVADPGIEEPCLAPTVFDQSIAFGPSLITQSCAVPPPGPASRCSKLAEAGCDSDRPLTIAGVSACVPILPRSTRRSHPVRILHSRVRMSNREASPMEVNAESDRLRRNLGFLLLVGARKKCVKNHEESEQQRNRNPRTTPIASAAQWSYAGCDVPPRLMPHSPAFFFFQACGLHQGIPTASPRASADSCPSRIEITPSSIISRRFYVVAQTKAHLARHAAERRDLRCLRP